VAVLPYERAVGLFDDDAYYYFGVARFIADGAGSTFNGLDNTNGYHPLWLGVLIPVFAVSSGQAALVWVAVLSGVLFIASGLLFDYVGRVVERPLIITVAATPVLVLAAAGPAFWFSGMETGLLLFLVLTVAAIFIRADQLRAAWFGCNWALGLGVLMALVVLARLDAIFPMVLLGVLAAFNWRSRRRRELAQLILALVTPPALILTGYFTLNLLAFDTLMPVSGQAKALGGASRNFEVILQFVAAPILFGQPIWLGAIALVVVPVAVAIAPVERALSAAARFSLVILLGSVVTVAYYAVTSSWRLWPWYFYGAPVALALAAPTLFDRISWGPRLWRLVAVATCGGTLMLVTANAVRVGHGSRRLAAPSLSVVRRLLLGLTGSCRWTSRSPWATGLEASDTTWIVRWSTSRAWSTPATTWKRYVRATSRISLLNGELDCMHVLMRIRASRSTPLSTDADCSPSQSRVTDPRCQSWFATQI